jgi:hypothetical protein
VFRRAKVSDLSNYNLSVFSFIDYDFGIKSKNSLHNSRS